jgi:hypothetical protein
VLKAEASLRVIQLQRRHAEVEDDAVDRATDFHGRSVELRKIGVLKHHGDVRRHRFPGKPLERVGVSVEAEQHSPWSKAFDEGPCIAAAAEGGVDERQPGLWLKAGYCFL